MVLGLAVFTGLLLLVIARPRSETSSGVQLLLTTPKLSSKSAFELRFDRDMVGQDQVGHFAAMSPLRIEPMLKGRFLWTSPRSGVYRPSEAPRLATEYRFRLTSGLTEASGRETTARLQRFMKMPGVKIANIRGNYHSTNNIPANPILRVAFNTKFDSEELAGVATFANGDQRIVAKVDAIKGTRLRGSRIPYAKGERTSEIPQTWASAFARADVADADELVGNAFEFRPEQTLDPGADWRLVIDSAALGGIPLEKPLEIRIGAVQPMTVRQLEPVNTLYGGKRIEVRLSRPVDLTIPNDEVLGHFTIAPRPENLAVRRGYRQFSLKGDFQLGVNYDVVLHPGLQTAYGLGMTEAYHTNFTFAAIRPHTRFPAYSASVPASGRGNLKFLAINSGWVDIRAKRLGPEVLIHALRGYDSVYKPWRTKHGEVAFDLVPGISLPSLKPYARAQMDTAAEMNLNLNRLTGRRRTPLFIEARPAMNPQQGATQTIVQFTDLGILWKRHAGGVYVHVFSLTTGRPLAGAEVFQLNDDNEILARSSTASRGLAGFKEFAAGKWIMATYQGDVHALRMDRHSLSRYGEGYRVAWRRFVEPQSKVLLFSDRPVYRAGDTAKFKLIARRLGDRVQHIETDKAKRGLRFSISDRRGDVVFATNAVPFANGTLDFAVPLPQRPLGKYHVKVNGNGLNGHHSFVIADYEPDAFEVKLGGGSSYRSGQPIEIPLHAQYLMGKELSSAKVRWSFNAHENRFTTDDFDEFTFCPNIRDHRLSEQPRGSSQSGEGTYTSDTNLIIRAGSSITNVTFFPRRVTLRANVTDLNQQTINASRNFTIESSAFYLGVKRPERWLSVGETYSPKIIAINADGTPRDKPVIIDVKLDRVEWHSIRVRQAGGTISYLNEPHRRNLVSLRTNSQVPVREGIGWRVDGALPLPELKETGQHLLEVTARDANGREARTSFLFDVTGPHKVAWNYRNNTRIELVPEKSEYRAGDRARVIVKTPIAGPALVTVERDKIHHAYTTNLTGNAPVVVVPVYGVDAPNTFVSVTVLRGTEGSPHEHPEPEFRYGFCQLKVLNPETALAVELKTSQPSYRPGELVSVACDVRNQDGKPVPDAEVTLYAVDEGVLNLTGYNTPDPLSFFNEERPLSVSTHLSLPLLLPENPALLQFDNKGFIAGGGGRMRMKARQNFEPCPLWEPSLRTDANGRVHGEFVAPDSLTRFRVIAVVHEGENRFGNDELKFAVNKPLMIEPVIPRFARRGDRIRAHALVLNNSTNAGTIEVTWRRQGAACTDGPPELSKRAKISAGGTTTIDFPMNFLETGTADWTWSAVLIGAEKTHVDSVVSKLPVREPLPLLSSVRVGAVSGTTNLLTGVDPVLLHGRGKVTVRLSHSPFLQLWGGVNYLLRYPYGCAEQTSSSLLPWLIVATDEAFQQLLGKTDAQVSEAVDNGVERLLSMQTRNGGLAYWPGSQRSEVFPSAYGGMMLALAKQGGVAIPVARLKRLADYLRNFLLNQPPRAMPAFDEQHGMALYTLALLGQRLPEIYIRIHDQRGALSAQTRLLTAMAILETGRTRADQNLAEQLADDLKPVDKRKGSRYFGSHIRRLAFEVIVHEDLASGRADTLRAELMKLRKGGHWYTTQGNAWTLLALSRVAASAKPPRGNARVSWGGNDHEVDLSAESIQTIEYPLSNAKAGQPLELRMPANQRIFAHVRVDSFVEESFKPVRSRGFEVERSYSEIDESGKAVAADQLEIGDTVLVTLKLKADEDAAYVAIDDPLPAVLEAINPEFKSRQSSTKTYLGYSWFSDHTELRKDRALFFRNRMPKGEFEIRYLARVRAEGKVIAAPTRVEEMYEPDRYGLSDRNHLEAKY